MIHKEETVARATYQTAIQGVINALNATVGECRHCHIVVLQVVLAAEIVEATWPESPLQLLHNVAAGLGLNATANIQLRTREAQNDCAGRA